MKTEVPQDVLDGISFLLVLASTSVDMGYAEKEEQENVEAVGRWFQKLTEEKPKKEYLEDFSWDKYAKDRM